MTTSAARAANRGGQCRWAAVLGWLTTTEFETTVRSVAATCSEEAATSGRTSVVIRSARDIAFLP